MGSRQVFMHQNGKSARKGIRNRPAVQVGRRRERVAQLSVEQTGNPGSKMIRKILLLLLVSMSSLAAEDDSTIVYDAAFFGQYPNAVSILDIVERIPAGNEIIRTNQRRSHPD
jgi:hypothetical protein